MISADLLVEVGGVVSLRLEFFKSVKTIMHLIVRIYSSKQDLYISKIVSIEIKMVNFTNNEKRV